MWLLFYDAKVSYAIIYLASETKQINKNGIKTITKNGTKKQRIVHRVLVALQDERKHPPP